MWVYHITEHVMTSQDGLKRFDGYSGAGYSFSEGRNNAGMEDVVGRGPIPIGWYSIGEPHHSPTTGPYTMNLDPQPGTDTLGRSAFRIHGNNAENDASHGCIILPPDARRAIWESGDHTLQVIA